MSSQRKRMREVGDLVSQIIQREGAALFSEILKEKALKQSPVSPAPQSNGPRFSSRRAMGEVSKWWSDIRSNGLVPVSRTRLEEALEKGRRSLQAGKNLAVHLKRSLWDAKGYYQSLPSPSERTEFLVLLALCSASYFGGLCVGSQVPRFDVRLFPIGRRADAITVHSAPLLSLEVSLAWMKAVLNRALVYPEIGDTDRRRLIGMIQLCTKLSVGIEAGVAARSKVVQAVPFLRRRQTRIRSIPMDAQSYQVADALLSALSGLKDQG
jgi:hypothetical protein